PPARRGLPARPRARDAPGGWHGPRDRPPLDDPGRRPENPGRHPLPPPPPGRGLTLPGAFAEECGADSCWRSWLDRCPVVTPICAPAGVTSRDPATIPATSTMSIVLRRPMCFPPFPCCPGVDDIPGESQ